MSPFSKKLGRKGQGLVELVVALPFLILLVFGILEISRLLEQQHAISGLTREGANIASRGATLQQALESTRDAQAAGGFGTDGAVVVSRLVVDDGLPYVVEQVASEGAGHTSRVALTDSIAAPYATSGLVEGHSYYVVEMFLPYESHTPLERLMASLVPELLYDRTLF